MSACRLNDLAHVRSDQLDTHVKTMTINPDQDKTHRERIIPLPADLCFDLEKIKGPVFLWERYLSRKAAMIRDAVGIEQPRLSASAGVKYLPVRISYNTAFRRCSISRDRR
jgi:hypothetical protein